MTDPISLKKAIDNIQDKQHVVSDEARRAKAAQYQDFSQLAQTNVMIHELNRSVRFMAGIFQSSHIDHVFLQFSRPLQLFAVQFLLGVVRGLGWIFGILVFLLFALHVGKLYLPTSFYVNLYTYLSHLNY